MGSPFYSLLPLEPFLPLNFGNLDQNVMCWRGGSLFLLGSFCCPYRSLSGLEGTRLSELKAGKECCVDLENRMQT